MNQEISLVHASFKDQVAEEPSNVESWSTHSQEGRSTHSQEGRSTHSQEGRSTHSQEGRSTRLPEVPSTSLQVHGNPNGGSEHRNGVTNPTVGGQPVRSPCADSEIENIWKLRHKLQTVPITESAQSWELHSLAESYWVEQAKEAAERLDAYSTRLAASNNELYQLVGFFSVFQGVLFTASAQSNLLCCPNVWIPLSLCGLITVFAIVGIHLKFKDVKEFRNQRNHFNQQHIHRKSQITKLRTRLGKGFQFKDPAALPQERDRRFRLLKYGIFLAVFIFSGIIGVGSYFILCRPGKPCI